MDDFYQLIDLDSGNVMDDFETSLEAFRFLAEAMNEHGKEAIRELSLMRIAGNTQELVAMQEELVRLVDETERASLTAHGGSNRQNN